MKQVMIAVITGLAVMASAATAQAYGYEVNCNNEFFSSILNECNEANHEPTQPARDDHEAWDGGFYAWLILGEFADGNVEVGIFNTYEIAREEFTSLVGAKIYLNRLFWQNKGTAISNLK